jgi:hypothetical protein
MRLHKFLGAFLMLLLLSCLYAVWAADSHYESFELEAEQHWETYGVGGTCIPGTHNLCVADVDNDGFLEMITGGFMYHYVDGSRMTFEAPLRVWSWNGQNIALKANQTWNGSIGCVYAADADGDDTVEVFTAGATRNDSNFSNSFKVWKWSNDDLTQKSEYKGVPINSIFVSDLNGDTVQEILSVGPLYKTSSNTSQLCLWHFKDNNITLVDTLDLDAAAVKSANSVYASDLDGDGSMEIIIAGYSDNLNNSKGQLCVWQWNGQEFSLKTNEMWQLVGGVCALTIAGQPQGNTIVNNVKAADVNGDGAKEIVTGGFAFDGERVNAQLKVWSWDGTALSQLYSEEWTSDYLTEVKCLTLNDVDGDGKTEIIGSGMVASKDSFANATAGHDRGQLKVWDWNGANFTVMQSLDWSINDGACAWNVGTGDVDKDGVTEIITVGCIALDTLCDPDMRIWSLPQIETFPFMLLVYVVIGAAVVIGLSILYFKRSKKT